MTEFKEADSGKHSVKSYAARVFKESSVGILSSFTQTSSNRRRCFKVFVLIFCLSGFLYQSIKFMTAFLQFHTVVNLEVKRPNIINVPAFTFCDNNGIKRSLFCKKYPDRCEEVGDENYKTLVPKKEFYNAMSNMSLEEMSMLNEKLSEFLLYHDIRRSNITGPFIRKTFEDDLNVKMCYSQNERINSSEDQLQESLLPLSKFPIKRFRFYIEENETFIPGVQPGILFSIHSPFIAVSPLENGIFMKPGRTYQIHVSMNEEVRLPKPYVTDCTNYTEVWIQNGRIGPRSKEMCQHSCLQGLSMECFNCVVPFLHFPTSERICSAGEANLIICPDHINERVLTCMNDCKEDCHRTKYRYSIQERYTIKADDAELPDSIENYVSVDVYVEDEEVIVLKHSPKYMVVELFSTLGGFVGCWLGISLLDITDIFEGFFRISQYAFRRR